jgi:dihydroorotase
MPLLAHVFEEEGALDRLEGFASRHGPAFYRLPVNTGQLRLVKGDAPTVWPAKLDTGAGPVTIFDPGYPVFWRVLD